MIEHAIAGENGAMPRQPDVMIFYNADQQNVENVATNSATVKSAFFLKAILQMALDGLETKLRLTQVKQMQDEFEAEKQRQTAAVQQQQQINNRIRGR
jgi:hypothetical protein